MQEEDLPSVEEINMMVLDELLNMPEDEKPGQRIPNKGQIEVAQTI